MKKFLFSIFVFILIIQTYSLAYSDGFSYMLEAMNIEKINVNGSVINEDIYNKYNLIVYGSPNMIKSDKQRFKEINNGRWSYLNGVWNGVGIRGEYWILGEDYVGKLVHNEYFPDDYNSGTQPSEWIYRTVKGAEESWLDTSKYQYEIQKEYMMNQKLSRFGKVYDITAFDIGLDKARVENYATWNSAGSIYTEKPGEGNIYWVATFRIEPMAGEAKLHSILELPYGNEYTLSKDATELVIPIDFGAYIDGISEYAKAEHVKIIESSLNINGERVCITSGRETLKVNKTYNLVVNKENYPNQNKIIFEVDCNSFMATYFNNDSILYDNKKVIITVNIETEERNKVPIINDIGAPTIYNCTLKRVIVDSKGKEELVNFYKSKRTNMQFICAGQVMKIEVLVSPNVRSASFDFTGMNSIRTFDKTTKKFEWDEPKERNVKTRYNILKEFEQLYNLPRNLKLEYETENEKMYSAYYIIPYETTQTLYSWNTLREESKNAFDIDESRLFTRKDYPYRIVISVYGAKGTTTRSYKFDVAERWDELYNRDLSKYITLK